MKHLVAVLAVFLLMGNQTLAQETIPEPEILEDLPDFVMVNKPVVCGPIKQVLKKIKEFNEGPAAAWMESEHKTGIGFWINENTGTTTVVELVGDKMCILSQGMNAVLMPNAEKIKGMPIRHLTY